MIAERYAPSSAIRERALQVHPAKPAPTMDDVLWYLDEQAKAHEKFAAKVQKAFQQVSDAFRSRRSRRAKPFGGSEVTGHTQDGTEVYGIGERKGTEP